MSDQMISKSLRYPYPLEVLPSKGRIWSQDVRRITRIASVIVLTRLAGSTSDVKELNRLSRRTAGPHRRFGGLPILGLAVRASIDRL